MRLFKIRQGNHPLSAISMILVFLVLGTSAAQLADEITVCANGCDFTTIQQALEAETTHAGDVILVKDEVHTEGGIVVTKNVTIAGLGAESTVVQAHTSLEESQERVFLIPQGVSAALRDLTIRYGHVLEEPMGGGGIRNEGELLVQACVISHNQAGSGGGLYNIGSLTLIDSTVSCNTTFGGAAILECNNGGGIKSLEGKVTLINTTISSNTALGKGAGMHIACKTRLFMENSTISGNSTTHDGGGIYLDGVAEINYSTIVGNSAHNGGGIYIDGDPEEGVERGLLHFTGTVIAENIVSLDKYGTADCLLGDHASIGTNTSNFVGDGSCVAAFNGDPLLAPLAVNGGLTQTHAPQVKSPLVDAVSSDQCTLNTDQIGQTRPSGRGCDIGSVEIQFDSALHSTDWLWGGSLGLVVVGLVIWLHMHKKRKVS